MWRGCSVEKQSPWGYRRPTSPWRGENNGAITCGFSWESQDSNSPACLAGSGCLWCFAFHLELKSCWYCPAEVISALSSETTRNNFEMLQNRHDDVSASSCKISSWAEWGGFKRRFCPHRYYLLVIPLDTFLSSIWVDSKATVKG